MWALRMFVDHELKNIINVSKRSRFSYGRKSCTEELRFSVTVSKSTDQADTSAKLIMLIYVDTTGEVYQLHWFLGITQNEIGLFVRNKGGCTISINFISANWIGWLDFIQNEPKNKCCSMGFKPFMWLTFLEVNIALQAVTETTSENYLRGIN